MASPKSQLCRHCQLLAAGEANVEVSQAENPPSSHAMKRGHKESKPSDIRHQTLGSGGNHLLGPVCFNMFQHVSTCFNMFQPFPGVEEVLSFSGALAAAEPDS